MGISEIFCRSKARHDDATMEHTRKEQQPTRNGVMLQQASRLEQQQRVLPGGYVEFPPRDMSPLTPNPQAEWFTMITDVCHRQQQVIDLVANLREQLEILHRKFEYHIKHRENIRVFDWRENDKSMRQEMADINIELTEALKALECIQAEYLELKGQQDELFGIPCSEPREVLTIQSNLRSASKK